MTYLNELDSCLRAFINDPNDFLDGIILVSALHRFPVLASEQPYAIDIDHQTVIPVFSDKTDLERFKKEQPSAREQNWIERSVIAVLQEVIEKGLTGLVFNVKKSGNFANSTIFKSSELLQFLNTHTTTLNQLMSEENEKAELMDKYFLVPAFVHSYADNSFDRQFPTLSTPEGKCYIPAFSTLQSFEKWYHHKTFGLSFQKARGSVLTWRLADIYQPRHGENAIDETVGVVINPLDEQQILVDWSEIEE